MKILQINKFYYLKGGSERYLFDLTKLLKRKGHRVIPFSMKDERNLPSKYSDYFIENINLHKFSLVNIFKFFYNYEAVKKLKKLIENEKPDIAHLHNIAHQLTPAIIKVLKENNIPIVQTLHDYKLICPNAKLFTKGKYCEACINGKYYYCFIKNCIHKSYFKSFLGMLEAYFNNRIKKSYQNIDLFIAPSEFIRNTCLKFGVSGKKIKVICNFVETEQLLKNFTRREEEYLLYFGRLSEEKGVEVLIRAMGEIKSKIKLKIVGAGPHRHKLETVREKLGLLDRVEFLGPKYGSALINLVNDSKAVIMPSIWPENMPYSLLESMSLGKVLIASKVGGMPELIQNGFNGFLFSQGDVSDLSKKIDDLRNYNLSDIGREAKNRVGHLNSENHYSNLINIYNKLV